MLFGTLFGFLLTIAGCGFLLWLGWRRIINHLKEDNEATEAFTKHVLIPVFGRKKSEPPKEELP